MSDSSASEKPVSDSDSTAGELLRHLDLAKKLFAQDWPDGDYRKHFKAIPGAAKDADPDWTKPDLAGRRYLALADTAAAHFHEWFNLFRGTEYDPQQREIEELKATIETLSGYEWQTARKLVDAVMAEVRSPAAPSQS